jgi:hypothetical protein
MVRGLDLFRDWFGEFSEQYVLIGGSAATLAMEEAGLQFRGTKDLDVVLHVEALTKEFGQTFWDFIQLLTPATRITLNGKLVVDMNRFVADAAKDESLDPKMPGIGGATVIEMLERIAQAYGLNAPPNGT